MPQILWEILVIFLLTLLNGFFSMSEIALVTVRKTRINSLVKKGIKPAKIIQLLQQNPESLFATIQIGISVITITASAYAGASLALDLSNLLNKTSVEFVVKNSYIISFVTVVVAGAYLSITIGELIPKSLGFRYSQSMALFAAYPIWWLSKICYPLIKFLNITSNLFLKIFRDSTTFTESRLSEEEIRSLLEEGKKAGTIEPREHEIIQNVFDFSDLMVEKIMVPKNKMTALNINLQPGEIVHKAIESGYSRIPVYKEKINDIVGILYTKKLLAKFDHDKNDLDIYEFLLSPYFVPKQMKISEVLRRLQKKKAHMALVTNGKKEIVGLITLEDLLEEIVGDISDETDELAQI